MKEKEIRKLDIQFRVEDNEEGKMQIRGYAAVYDSPETYWYTEQIAKGAFDEADMSDVVLRYNHNDNFMVLARTRNKSLDLNISFPRESILFGISMFIRQLQYANA